jgi:hypothetical protein
VTRSTSEVQKCLTGQITADACCDNLISARREEEESPTAAGALPAEPGCVLNPWWATGLSDKDPALDLQVTARGQARHRRDRDFAGTLPLMNLPTLVCLPWRWLDPVIYAGYSCLCTASGSDNPQRRVPICRLENCARLLTTGRSGLR